MAKKKQPVVGPSVRPGRAPEHGELANNGVHVFVDDQNLFWGLLNSGKSRGYRIDFGRLLMAASKDAQGNTRFVKSAYIAGVIPDEDSFWSFVEKQGFVVKRGYLSGSPGNQRSKQDDAYLITEITCSLYEQEGPSTIVLVAGDADYVPPLLKANEKNWRVEVAFIDRGLSSSLDPVVHEFRTMSSSTIELLSKS